MNKKIPNTKYQIPNTNGGLTLIEILVAISCFAIILVGILSTFSSSITSFGKSRAIKRVVEDTHFAMTAIAKDVRMGKIEPIAAYSDGSLKQYLMISRNRGGKICYYLDRTAGSSGIGVISGVADDASDCPDPSTYDKIVDLSGTEMNFSSSAGFYSCPTDTSATESPCLATLGEKGRGWAEINLDVEMVSGKEMEADQINVQTIVSSRDYGWEDIN